MGHKAVALYFLIVHPGFNKLIFTPCRSILILAASLLFVCALLLPTLLGRWGRFGYDATTFACTVLPTDDTSALRFLSALAFALPAATIVICYSHIACVVRRRHELRRQTSSAPGRRSADTRLTLMIVSILILHVLCFLPYAVVHGVPPTATFSADARVGVEVLTWASHAVNPYVYAIVNKSYRFAYIALVPCRRLRARLRTGDPSGDTSEPRTSSRDRMNTIDFRPSPALSVSERFRPVRSHDVTPENVAPEVEPAGQTDTTVATSSG
ncbi:PREDICTED: G-protein coupled receptor moody-like [Priapulus caudatus]|uniref:G-protein coupled receptor moody-like n=1 Tax=Priapulus caudatus TaxID=37621 RepID=A0ABM1EZD7_PRICU|nr:PREDICTED: G-protein coupled receptor moody-like [Priapulus caudatus]